MLGLTRHLGVLKFKRNYFLRLAIGLVKASIFSSSGYIASLFFSLKLNFEYNIKFMIEIITQGIMFYLMLDLLAIKSNQFHLRCICQ